MKIAIRRGVIKLELGKYLILLGRVGKYSFGIGGVMALKFAGAGQDDITKMGRWSFDAFLIYTHDQIVEYSEG